MSAQHTSGPFDLSMGTGGGGGLFVRDAKRRLIAGFQTTSLSDSMLPGEGEANAQLFIAAGDMREALRRVIDSPFEPDKWRREVEMAYAKANEETA